ncbi:S8 family peptidase [Pengzhenrongella sicca]|uniref:S8 family serine peptidase n=1 Tax=Pengzhenrongella sicca TaxID=2819238 RepID=A0A8A4ZJ02_9MICO|nr:S8 family serine peptidase [Pengzhenrongella sicca]QTE29578.1 S8 family serine peptidase [Pengzhenrongella sicca]
MVRTRRSVALVGIAALAAALVSTSTAAQATPGAAAGAAADATDTSTYVVLADDAAAVDGAIAAVQAAGGTVDRVNRAIGLVTAASSAESFAATVSAEPAVAGVARDRPVGSAPQDVAASRDAVEKEGRNPDAAARSSALLRTDGRSPGHGPGKGPGKGHGPVTPEPLAGYQWDMKMIGATATGSYVKQPGRKDVLVGVIDTGIDGSHPDIAPNFNSALSRNFTTDIELIDGPCAEEADQSCEDAADVDEDGHGTHVAGTIAAPINGLGMAGVAPNVSLVNLRAGQDSGYFFLAATVDALTYAGDNGIDVVNMSFYIDPWLFNCRANPADSAAEQLEQATIIDATQRALDYARGHGVTLISALGNDNTDLGLAVKTDESSPDFPPGTEKTRTVTNDCLDMPTEANGVISVSSVGPSGKKSDFSNHGLEQNDISAPGGFYRDYVGTNKFSTPGNLILGPYPKALAIANGEVDPVTGESLSDFVVAECSAAGIDSCAYYQLIQGTSMAAPHAVGVAALIVSKDGKRDRVHGGRTMDPVAVEKVLRQTATDVACPAPVVTYAAEGRDASYDAPCVGNVWKNSIYGTGIVNALRAVR